jgi:hypothetical protein
MIRWATSVFAFLFIVLVVMVSYCNRPAADDFYYLYCVPESGIFTCVKDLYYGYSARWAAYLLAAAVIPVRGLFALFPLLSVLLISLVCSGIIRILSNRMFSITLSPASAFTSGVLMCSAFFFTSFSIPESWFWLIQVCTYAMSMAAQLTLLYCLLSEKKNRLLLLTAAVFAGGSSESYALILLAALVMLFVFRKKLSPDIFPANDFRFKIRLALTGCFISFLIMMSSKGNLVRYEALPEAAPLPLIWTVIKTWGKAIVLKPFQVLPYYLLFGLLAFYFGRGIAVESRISLAAFACRWIKVLFLIPFLVLGMILPATVVMAGPPPDRAMMQVSFALAALVMSLFFDAGRKLNTLPFENAAFRFIVAAGIIILIAMTTIQQGVVAHRYAKAYDERMLYLKEMKSKGHQEPVALEPLPESGMIYSAEISEYDVHFTNSFLKKYLQLNFEIRKAGTTSGNEQYQTAD